MTTVREELIVMRDELWEKLAAMIAGIPDAVKVLNRIRAMDTAIAKTDPPALPSEYSKYKRASDAILTYLEKVGKPVPRDVLTAALKDGGFRLGEKNPEFIIRQSLDSFLKGRGRATKLIKEINGLVGNGNWPDEWFTTLASKPDAAVATYSG